MARIWAVIAICFGLVVSINQAVAASQNVEVQSQSEYSEAEALERLQKAIDQAVKDGKTEIHIDLNETPEHVQSGDIATIKYTLSEENGDLLFTTDDQVARNQARRKAAWYEPPRVYEPEKVVGGQSRTTLPLGDMVLNMGVGQENRIVLAPEQAFGAFDPKKRVDVPCVQKMPRIIRVSAEDYVGWFKSFPMHKKHVDISPHLRARVHHIEEMFTELEILAESGRIYDESFGTLRIEEDKDNVTTIITPRIGSRYSLNGAEGRIVAADKEKFTVDFNHPAAGKNVVLELKVLSIVKRSSYAGTAIKWIEEHDEGLVAAREESKPVVLVLYASWCKWCKKMFTDTFDDPRVRILEKEYIWMKVDSDKESKYKTMYKQSSFPLLVLMDATGEVVDKIEGYVDAKTLDIALERFRKRAAPEEVPQPPLASSLKREGA